jgi:hypothetical protein
MAESGFGIKANLMDIVQKHWHFVFCTRCNSRPAELGLAVYQHSFKNYFMRILFHCGKLNTALELSELKGEC